MKEVFAARIERIRELAGGQGIDYVVLVPGTNLFYLTGLEMHLSERPTMLFIPVGGAEPAWFAPLLEFEKVQELTGIQKGVAWSDEKGPSAPLDQLLAGLGFSRDGRLLVGCEFRSMRLLEWELLREAVPGVRRADVGPLLANLRQKKDEHELKLMVEAVKIAEEVLEAGRQALNPGITERELANLITQELMRLGSPPAFGPSVAFGANSGFPHAQVGDRVLQEGDLVWIDMGAVYRGYCSDITRTFAVGEVDEELRRIYQVVYEAQRRAREEARPGMTAGQVDDICRSVITSAGYGEYFTHRTGHGLGLDVHEEPYMVKGSDVVLEPGMVFTIEPGIYLPGRGGVRIEDDVVVTEDGLRSLTTYRRNWLE